MFGVDERFYGLAFVYLSSVLAYVEPFSPLREGAESTHADQLGRY